MPQASGTTLDCNLCFFSQKSHKKELDTPRKRSNEATAELSHSQSSKGGNCTRTTLNCPRTKSSFSELTHHSHWYIKTCGEAEEAKRKYSLHGRHLAAAVHRHRTKRLGLLLKSTLNGLCSRERPGASGRVRSFGGQGPPFGSRS